MQIPHCTIVARPVIISKENSRDELDEELTNKLRALDVGLFYILYFLKWIISQIKYGGTNMSDKDPENIKIVEPM